jgi:hypothetical protein
LAADGVGGRVGLVAASQAPLVAVVAFLLAFLVGFLTAG